MLAFLGTEYGDAQLEFFLEAQKMLELEGQAQQDAAVKVYSQFVAAQGSGIGAQDRTKGTQDLWDKCNKESADAVDGANAVAVVTDEADKTLNMLAFDAFPRFLKSKYCEAVMDDIKKKSNPGEVRTHSFVVVVHDLSGEARVRDVCDNCLRQIGVLGVNYLRKDAECLQQRTKCRGSKVWQRRLYTSQSLPAFVNNVRSQRHWKGRSARLDPRCLKMPMTG